MHGFDASNPPFDRLNEQEVGSLTASIDIGYFAPGEVIVRRSAASERLHVIIKGAVEVKDGADLHAVLGPKDTFDSRALVHGAAGEDFVAAEETLCYLVPRERVLTLIRDNPAFAAFFYADVSRKLDALSDTRKVEGMESVLRERIRNVRRGPAVFVEGATTIEEAGRAMRDNDINSLFVREGTRVGVVTGMNLSKAVVLDRLPLHTPVRDLCRFEVVSVDSDDFIFDALLAMTRYGKRRLAIRADGAFVGFLEDIDLLGLFAGNSQLIPGRIDRARGLDDLAAAARDIQDQVERLHRQGLKVDLIAEITSDLNRRLHRKLYEMVATPGIRENGCLVLLGIRGPGRADGPNGPGQRAAACPGASGRGSRRVPIGLLRGACGLRLSHLPGQRDGEQPGLVAVAGRVSSAVAPVGPRSKPGGRDEYRDLLRCRSGGGEFRAGDASEAGPRRADARGERADRPLRSPDQVFRDAEPRPPRYPHGLRWGCVGRDRSQAVGDFSDRPRRTGSRCR